MFRAVFRLRRHGPRRLFSTAPSRNGDPWLLPNTPEHIASTTTTTTTTPSEDHSVPTPLPRSNESLAILRARLLYQSRKRGTLESDLLLSTFAREHLDTMSMDELHEYDKLLDESDWDIYYWSTGKRAVPTRWSSSSVLAKLVVHARNEGKVVRSMPALS